MIKAEKNIKVLCQWLGKISFQEDQKLKSGSNFIEKNLKEN
jgi:hypothetical protein